MIEAVDLIKRFGDVEVLRGASLRVAAGEVAVLIGPSGSGKSTFLRCLNGLETFQNGSVSVDGISLRAGMPPSEREPRLHQIRLRLGMVFQAFHLFPHRTVLQNITEGPVHVLGLDPREAEARARRLLDRVGLADRLRAMPHELSGGQQQRVAIARALAMEPRAILFDEPTSALDPHMTGEVLAVLSDLARDGQTMLIVTHAIPVARHVAHTVHVFHAGRIIESGPPAQVLDAPHEEATRLLLAEAYAA
jgi:ABC-type polar amino acid transport system ATPase subunit